MSIADRLLERLDGVRQSAESRWMAKCPAHTDKSPSLAIRETDDRLLVHCFGGCATHAILASVGLSLSDLYATPLPSSKGGKANHWHAAKAALKAVAKDSVFVLVAAENMARGIVLKEADRLRLADAVNKINQAMTLL